MAQHGSGSVRVHFTKDGQTPGLLETGHPYPNVDWLIEGGVLYMRFTGGSASGKNWDYIFGPAKWSWLEQID